MVKSIEDTLACTYGWSFNDKPEASNMDILSFQPNSRSFNISFVPDVAGDYVVAYTIMGPDGKIKDEKELLCSIIEDTSRTETIDEEGYALSEEALSAPLPVYGDLKSTAIPEKKTYAPPTVPKAVTPISRSAQPRGQKIPVIPGKYTIQISSWKTYAGAERATGLLANLNLDLYIQKATFEETGETWYRVRAGNFDTRTAARNAMNDLKIKLPREQLWIDLVRQDQ
ncbi:MAG: SPOR domain-containing protein [Candidatus Marinimicrobia bacterium]|nr:SPOR domain-containing protein [Candidatus Neomarinimicrobiota bacterium]